MATQTVTVNTNADAIAAGAWRSNDTLVINNGAVVTVNTDQKKFWNVVTITNGKLRIENNSPTTPLRFLMGRSSGTTSPAITPSGLGSIEIAGNWIEIGTGDGLPGQVFTAPYTDHIAAIWVETGAGTGVYEAWTNVLSHYGFAEKHAMEGLMCWGSGQRGRVFEQGVRANCNEYLVKTNCGTTNTSRNVNIGSTANVFVGALIVGSINIPANSVVERIVDATTVEINQAATGTSAAVTCTIYNPFAGDLTGALTVGDGVHGNVVPAGAKVRIPNIMLTAVFGCNLSNATNSKDGGMEITLTSGGALTADTCLFDYFHGGFNQPARLELSRIGFSYAYQPIIKAYGLVIDDVAFSEVPRRNWIVNNRWMQGAWYTPAAGSGLVYFAYVSGTINKLTAQLLQVSTTGSGLAAGIMVVRYADGLQCSNLLFGEAIGAGSPSATRVALSLSYVNNSVFDGLLSYGAAPLYSEYSSDNQILNWEWSFVAFAPHIQPLGDLGNAYSGNGKNPAADDFVDGTPYFFVRRFYRDALGLGVSESREVSATPFKPSIAYPATLSVSPGNGSVVLSWDLSGPTHTAPAWEIYRSATPGCPVRDAGTRIFTTNTATTATYTDSTAVNGTEYFYVLRHHESAGVYEDSPAISAVPQLMVTAPNLMLQTGYNISNASWTKSGCSVPATSTFDATGINAPFGRDDPALRQTVLSAAVGTLTISVTGLTVAQTYTAGIYIRFPGYCANAVAEVVSATGQIALGTATQSFTATKNWQRVFVSFTATGTSHNFVVTLNGASGYRFDIDVIGCQRGASMFAALPVTTTAASGALAYDITLVAHRVHSRGGEVANQGIMLFAPTYVIGAYVFSKHIGTSRGFTRNLDNLAMLQSGATTQGQNFLLTLNSARNVLRGVHQWGSGVRGHASLVQINSSSSDNLFQDITMDLGFRANTVTTSLGLFSILTDANRNKFKDWVVKNNTVMVSTWPVTFMDNTANGTVFENVDITPTASYLMALNNDMIVKGMGVGNASAATNATTWAMGATGDGVPVTFTAVYDTIFAELYHTETTGALNIFFCPSTASAKPYVLTGTAAFNSAGALYFQTPGDSATYTWPHKIYGVSGFRNIAHKVYQADLGADPDQLSSVLLEFQIDTGSGYTAWAEATPAALSALTVSAVDGFYLKLRLTARQFLVYSTQTVGFSVGEVFQQQTSLARAEVVADYDSGSYGTLVIQNIVGTFTNTASLDLQSYPGGVSKAGATSLVNGFVLGPSFTSRIQGLQIHTLIDKSVQYPDNPAVLTLTGLPAGCDVVVLDAGSETILDQQDSLAGTTYSYTYFGAQTVDIGLIKPGYVPYYIRGLSLGASDSTIPVSLMLDRNYQ